MKAADLVPMTTVYATQRGGTTRRAARKAVVLAEGMWNLSAGRGEGERHRTITRASKGNRAGRSTLPWAPVIGTLVLDAKPSVDGAILLEAVKGIQVDDLADGLDRVHQQLGEGLRVTVVPSREIQGTWSQIEAEWAAEDQSAAQAAEYEQQQLVRLAEQRLALASLASRLGVAMELPSYEEAVTLSYADMIAVLERLATAEGFAL